jgi:hypothetical protein
MPWKVCKPMDERLKFIARLLDGEQMAGLCREFGISRRRDHAETSLGPIPGRPHGPEGSQRANHRKLS